MARQTIEGREAMRIRWAPAGAEEWTESMGEREGGGPHTVLGGEAKLLTPAREVVYVAA